MTLAAAHPLPPSAVNEGEFPAARSGALDDSPGSEGFVAATARASCCLPAAIDNALRAFVGDPPRAGAVVLRGIPVGDPPATPASPTTIAPKDLVSEASLLTVACRLGEPVGYLPEHGGDIVQNIVPTRAGADRQISTSSRASLMFHTEASFHPHRPRYLLLLCLRGDAAAATTLASIRVIAPLLSPRTVDTLFEPRFRTAVDESYLHGRRNTLGPPMAVLRGPRDRPSIVFDAELTIGIDDEAAAALAQLSAALDECHAAVALDAGDLLVIDNDVAVHGRSAFTPRFDGNDRWVQRSFVVDSLDPTAGVRRGRVICTTFGV